MSTEPHFPPDTNGNLLRRMYGDGDDLTKPRIVDFCFVFPDRRTALSFAEIIDDKEKEVSISYYEARFMWQVIVKHHMVPTYDGITTIETDLKVKAESVGGEADGWGCMRTPHKD